MPTATVQSKSEQHNSIISDFVQKVEALLKSVNKKGPVPREDVATFKEGFSDLTSRARTDSMLRKDPRVHEAVAKLADEARRQIDALKKIRQMTNLSGANRSWAESSIKQLENLLQSI